MLLVSVKIATAQTVDLSTLEQCAGLETQELKLACFEAIIASSKTPDTSEPEAIDFPEYESPVADIEARPEAQPPAEVMPQEAPAVDAAPESTPAAVSTSTAAVTVTTEPPVEVVPQEAPAVDATPESTPAAVATWTAAVAVTPEPSAATVTTTPEPLASSQLGEEHLDRPEADKKANEDEVFHAKVTEVTRGRNKILYFHFDNGQVWRQMEARHLEYPRSGEFEIYITRGMMGDYRLRIGDNGRMVRIRRVQ
ncbi:MAG: hypothetical protein E2O53_11855 [Gammaproteobacteria bacterium]|nr:MAG: hypothetical protein E2O53_11855 [Gammaproteobacteria bacterium]